MSVQLRVSGSDLAMLLDKYPDVELEIAKGSVANLADALAKRWMKRLENDKKLAIIEAKELFNGRARSEFFEWDRNGKLRVKKDQEEVIDKIIYERFFEFLKDLINNGYDGAAIRNEIDGAVRRMVKKGLRDEIKREVGEMIGPLVDAEVNRILAEKLGVQK